MNYDIYVPRSHSEGLSNVTACVGCNELRAVQEFEAEQDLDICWLFFKNILVQGEKPDVCVCVLKELIFYKLNLKGI